MKILMRLHFTFAILLLSNGAFSQSKTAGPGSDTKIKDSVAIHMDSIPHATFYFYRSYIRPMNAPIKKVPIYINDSLVYKLKANNIIAFKVYKEGKFTIAIDDKGDTDISVKVKFGKEYFFKCEIVKGLWFGQPSIEAVTPATGRAESGVLIND